MSMIRQAIERALLEVARGDMEGVWEALRDLDLPEGESWADYLRVAREAVDPQGPNRGILWPHGVRVALRTALNLIGEEPPEAWPGAGPYLRALADRPGPFVRRLLSLLGISQEALARRIGVSLNTVARWSRDEVAPTSAKAVLGLVLLAQEAGLDPEDL